MPDRRFLTDRFLRSLSPAKLPHIDDIWDTSISGFGVRVYDAKDPTRNGKAANIAFPMYSRFAGPIPARSIIDVYAGISWGIS